MKIRHAAFAVISVCLTGCNSAKIETMFSPEQICTSDETAQTLVKIIFKDGGGFASMNNDFVKRNATFAIEDATLNKVDRLKGKVSCSIILKETLSSDFVTKYDFALDEFKSNRITFTVQPTLKNDELLYQIESSQDSYGDLFTPQWFLVMSNIVDGHKIEEKSLEANPSGEISQSSSGEATSFDEDQGQ